MAKVFRAPEDLEPPSFAHYIKQGKDLTAGLDALHEAESEYLEALAQRCQRHGKSPLLGKEVRWQRADGYARYMVWRTRPLELIWLQLGDAWSVEEELIRGLRVSDVQRIVSTQERRAEFLGRR